MPPLNMLPVTHFIILLQHFIAVKFFFNFFCYLVVSDSFAFAKQFYKTG